MWVEKEMGRTYNKNHHLTEEQKKLVADNLPLVHWYMKKHINEKLAGANERDEVDSFLRWRLCLAAETFDPSKAKFSTYAGLALRHGWSQYRRERSFFRGRYKVVDLNSMIETEEDENDIKLPCHYRDSQPDYSKKVQWDDIKHLFDLIKLTPQEKQIIFFYHEKRYSFNEIGKLMGCTGANISHFYKKAIAKVKKLVHRKKMKFDDAIFV